MREEITRRKLNSIFDALEFRILDETESIQIKQYWRELSDRLRE